MSNDNTFHMRLEDGAENWVKPVPAQIGIGLKVGDEVEVHGSWSHQVTGDRVRIFSARELYKAESE